MMRCNVGENERWTRLAAGVIAAWAIPGTSRVWLQIPLAAVAVAALGTGLSRYCPLNARLGIDTCTNRGKARWFGRSGVRDRLGIFAR